MGILKAFWWWFTTPTGEFLGMPEYTRGRRAPNHTNSDLGGEPGSEKPALQ